MDADDLRIVEAVARIGSMNRAAAELNMVQSNVTSRIRLLEEELGVQLFVRHSHGVKPSEAGLRLLSYGEQIHTLFKHAITAVKEDGTPKGKLRIGMMETTAARAHSPVRARISKGRVGPRDGHYGIPDPSGGGTRVGGCLCSGAGSSSGTERGDTIPRRPCSREPSIRTELR
jgi:hypothetical protein